MKNDEGGSMRKYRWGLLLAVLLLLSVTSSLTATDGAETVLQPQDEPTLARAMQNLAIERDSWSHSYDWGARAEYPQRLIEYNEQMQTFQLEQLQLQLKLYRLRGNEVAADRTANNIDQLVNGIEGTPQNLPRELPVGEDDSLEGGTR
jgi:TolA-binding protein